MFKGRLRPLALASALLGASAHSPHAAEGPARVALVLSEANYPDAGRPLTTPVTDGRTVAEALGRRGFAVQIAADAGGSPMSDAIRHFLDAIRPGAIAVVYFSGIGIQVADKNYLVPVDARIWSDADVLRAGTSVDALVRSMADRGAAAEAVILDASRRNPFERRFRSVSAGLAAMNALPGTLFLASAAPGSLLDDDGAESVFAAQLAKAIETPGIDAEQAFLLCRDQVAARTQSRQGPSVVSGLDVPFSFDPDQAAKPAAAAPPQGPAPALKVEAAAKPAPVMPPAATSSTTAPPPAAKPMAPPAPAPAATSEPVKVAAAPPTSTPSTGVSPVATPEPVHSAASAPAPELPAKVATASPAMPAADAPPPIVPPPAAKASAAAPEPAPAAASPPASEPPAKVATLSPAVPVADAPPPAAKASAPAEANRPAPAQPVKVAAPPSKDGAAEPSAETPLSPAERARRAELDRRIGRDPHDQDALFGRGRLLAQHGSYTLALLDFDRAISLAPNDADAFNDRCWTRSMVGQLQTAMDDCDHALRLRPDFADAHDSRGLVHMKRGSAEAALVDYDAAIRLDPKQSSALYGRGIAELRLGRREAAEKDISDALALDPGIEAEYARYGLK